MQLRFFFLVETLLNNAFNVKPSRKKTHEIPRSHFHLKLSHKSHARTFLQNGLGRDYTAAVTGLRGIYGVYEMLIKK